MARKHSWGRVIREMSATGSPSTRIRSAMAPASTTPSRPGWGFRIRQIEALLGHPITITPKAA